MLEHLTRDACGGLLIAAIVFWVGVRLIAGREGLWKVAAGAGGLTLLSSVGSGLSDKTDTATVAVRGVILSATATGATAIILAVCGGVHAALKQQFEEIRRRRKWREMERGWRQALAFKDELKSTQRAKAEYTPAPEPIPPKPSLIRLAEDINWEFKEKVKLAALYEEESLREAFVADAKVQKAMKLNELRERYESHPNDFAMEGRELFDVHDGGIGIGQEHGRGDQAGGAGDPGIGCGGEG